MERRETYFYFQKILRRTVNFFKALLACIGYSLHGGVAVLSRALSIGEAIRIAVSDRFGCSGEGEMLGHGMMRY